MKDQTSTNQELIEENALLKQRIQELEKSEAGLGSPIKRPLSREKSPPTQEKWFLENPTH